MYVTVIGYTLDQCIYHSQNRLLVPTIHYICIYMHNQFFFVICKMSASISMTLQLNPIFSFYVKTVFFLCDPQLFYLFTFFFYDFTIELDNLL